VAKFRKKPVVIEAVQFTGKNAFEVWRFMGRMDLVDNLDVQNTDRPVIETLEGNLVASPGDWIIRGVKGEFYPCKPDIFAATYEPVSEGLRPHVPPKPNRPKQYA
jgi:hypothetical protein